MLGDCIFQCSKLVVVMVCLLWVNLASAKAQEERPPFRTVPPTEMPPLPTAPPTETPPLDLQYPTDGEPPREIVELEIPESDSIPSALHDEMLFLPPSPEEDESIAPDEQLDPDEGKGVTVSKQVGGGAVQKVHCILVFDTDGRNIRKSVSADKQLVFNNLVLPLKKNGRLGRCICLTGGKVTPAGVIRAIRLIHLRQDCDTLLFYYSGHGGMNGSGNHFMDIRHSSSYHGQTWNHLPYGRVAREIVAKGPSLGVMLCDACAGSETRGSVPTGGGQKGNGAVLSKLLLGISGFVQICAAKPGKTAEATTTGGVFTIALCNVLNDDLQNLSGNLVWSEFLRKISAQTELASAFGRGQPCDAIVLRMWPRL